MTPQPFTFLTATEIRFGRGQAGTAAATIVGFGQRVLLVHGANRNRAEWLMQALQNLGAEVTGFACPIEPNVALIDAGVNAARAARAEVIVSLGGGAVIDAGKAIAALAVAVRPMRDHLEVVGKGLALDVAPLPFIALPTTSGTGAEVTKNAVIGVPEARRKVSLRDNRMLPRVAIVDPALTDGCPRAVTLASGLDAITQVIEPYVSKKSNIFSDALCRDAIRRGLPALMVLMAEDGQIAHPTAVISDARDEMAWVSLCGGMALANAGLGAVHGLAGPIGGVSPAAHGAVCGVLLPHVLRVNLEQARVEDSGGQAATRLTEVCDWLGSALGVDGRDAPEALADWSAAQGLAGLTALGLDPALHLEVAEAAITSSSMRGNPVTLDRDTLALILAQAS